jgi:hypothetical protein
MGILSKLRDHTKLSVLLRFTSESVLIIVGQRPGKLPVTQPFDEAKL